MKKQRRKRPQKKQKKDTKLLVTLAAAIVLAVILVAIFVGRESPPVQPVVHEIRDWYDLDAVRNDLAASYRLLNDLTAAHAGYGELASALANGGQGWQPLGTQAEPFTGSLDGQGYSIRDLVINRPGEHDVGLFGSIGPGGVVEKTSLGNVTVSGGGSVGALAGHNFEGIVRKCRSDGVVTGGVTVAGLVGVNRGEVDDCLSGCNVTGEEDVGGLVGLNDRGVIRNSYSTSNVTGVRAVGGLVALNLQGGVVNNSYYSYDDVMVNGRGIITIGALPGEDFAQWLGGGMSLDISGRLTKDDGYYVVNSLADLKSLLALGQDASAKLRLKADLDLRGEPGFYIPYFAGEIDGNGHKISNLSLNEAAVGQVGLFGCLASSAKVNRISVVNASVAGFRYAGGLAGYNWQGTVDRSYVMGAVTGEWYVGGLIGYNVGLVRNSYSLSEVTGYAAIGGLIGASAGNVIASYSNCTVSGSWSLVGGLIGHNDEGTVKDCYSTGSASCVQSVGGLVGGNLGNIDKCYSTAKVTGNYSVGGLAGADPFWAVTYSFWDKETSATELGDVGVGLTTAMMQDVSTFAAAYWDIVAVNPGETNTDHTWNIVNGRTYPFLSWQSTP